MSLNLVTLLYLIASVSFIQALKGLSHPTTSIRGNVFGMIGMTIAVLTTAALIVKLSGEMGQARAQGMVWVLGGLLVGGTLGTIMAKLFRDQDTLEVDGFNVVREERYLPRDHHTEGGSFKSKTYTITRP